MTENGEAPVFQEDDQGKQRTGYCTSCIRDLLRCIFVTISQGDLPIPSSTI